MKQNKKNLEIWCSNFTGTTMWWFNH